MRKAKQMTAKLRLKPASHLERGRRAKARDRNKHDPRPLLHGGRQGPCAPVFKSGNKGARNSREENDQLRAGRKLAGWK